MSAPHRHDCPREEATRTTDDTLRQLGGHLAWHGRTVFVNDELERHLRQLDGLAWHFDRSLPLCGKCIPFVLFGPSGVFLLAGSRGQWTSDDLASMSTAADAIGSVMPGYASPIRTVLVIIGDHQAPRQHFTGIGDGPCWVLGEGWLLPWLYRFRDHGLAEPDIARLRGMADASVLRERRRTVIPSGHG